MELLRHIITLEPTQEHYNNGRCGVSLNTIEWVFLYLDHYSSW